MLSISTTNLGAGFAITGTSSQDRIDTSIERLSTGKRINAAKDDVAGSSISTRLTAEIMGLNQATRNAADAQGLLDTAEGALQEVETHLLRIRELTVQSQNGTLSDTDKASLNNEVQQRIAAIDSISTNTSYGGLSLLDGTFKDKSFQISASSTNALNATIGGSSATDLDIEHFSLTANKHTVVGSGVDDNVLFNSGTVISDNKGTIFKIEIIEKNTSDNGYTHRTGEYKYIRINTYNGRENKFDQQDIELSRNNISWQGDASYGHIEDAKILSNGKMAIVKDVDGNSTSYLLLILDLENGQLSFPSEAQALTDSQQTSRHSFVTPTYPDGNFHGAFRARLVDLENSEFAVVWDDQDAYPGNMRLFLQKFDYQGNKMDEVQALSATNGTGRYHIRDYTHVGDGIVVGATHGANGPLHIRGFDTKTNTIVFETQISSNYIGALSSLSSVYATSKGFGVVWSEDYNGPTFFQQFDQHGTQLASKIQILDHGSKMVILSRTRNGDEFLDIEGRIRLTLEGEVLIDGTGSSIPTSGSAGSDRLFAVDNGDLVKLTYVDGTKNELRFLDFTENTTSTIDSALDMVNEDRASLGSLSNRLDNIMAVNMNTSIGLTKANGLIEDAKYAQETADLAKNQILQQASIQMQVLRNRSGDNILELLSSNSFLY